MGKNKRSVGVPTQNISPVTKEVEKQDKKREEPMLDNTIRIVSVTEEVDGEVEVQTHLNVRSTPEVKADNVVTILKKGTRVKVYDPKKKLEGSGEQWYKIEVHNVDPKITGYVMKKYIKIL